MIVVYDLEQFSNFHSCFAIDRETRKEYYFEISDFKDDSIPYYEFLQECKGMIGFNNLSYDYPLLHWFLTKGYKKFSGGELAREMYRESQNIIKSKWGIPEWKMLIPQRDLFTIHHFNNKARMTGLKDLQVVMNWHNVQDLPFKHNHHVAEEDREKIKEYNRNDTLSTDKFYELSLDAIQMRRDLRNTYQIPCMNWPDTKIGEQILLKKIAEAKGISPRMLAKQRTYREHINLGECIVDYDVKNKELSPFLNLIKGKKITETKGSIKYRILYDGMPYDFGTGGIHGCRDSKKYESTDTHVIMTSDVASYYPNIGIRFRLYPEHLGEVFCEVYEEVYDRRDYAKKHNIDAENKGLKLGLNGAYGKSNDVYSFLYDPKYTMTVTISGQVMLTDLSITLQKAGFEAIMINTDGFEFIVPRDRVGEYKTICKEWEEETKLVLEHGSYDVIAIRDCNNYVAKDSYGNVKTKGAFEINKDWHKDPSFKIIPIALKEYFINGTPISDTINSHDNIFDFCGRIKSNSGYKIDYHYLEDNEEKIKRLQKTNRVFISNKGGHTYKRKSNREERVYVGCKVTLFNKYYKSEDYNINRQWYINETQKIIDIIEPKQMSLF